jgi:hypothetical protein
VRRALLGWMLGRAAAPDGARFAAMLPRLEGAVPRTAAGAQMAREMCSDERWSARYLAGRVLGRFPPEALDPDDAWTRLLALAGDEHTVVREAAPFGLAALAAREPATAERMAVLLTDAGAPRAARRAALRSLVPLVVDPPTRAAGERLLREAALTDAGINRGVGAVILGRGIAARDPELALRIAHEWENSPEPALRRHAARALRAPLCAAEPAACTAEAQPAVALHAVNAR